VFVPAAAPTQAASTVTFAALGNVIANADATPSINRIDVTNVNVTGAMRPLRIIVNAGGSIRMCDPSLAASDARGCPAFP
jgi:type IV fimbrial biogenesis protein FimT